MSRPLVYGSVCSGIEAATAAWHPLGWKPAFFSEIDNFPRAVLQHHYPSVPLHGDFTTIERNHYAAIDLLVGGTPCQAFSVAGLRQGFADERGNLTLEFVRLAQRLRPRWLVWENVPGVLSIDRGRAFGSFLGGLAECGYGFAYRVLDAQHFGVPQRRRRVFVVGHLGDWRPAAAVLFESQSLLRDLTPSRETRESTAYNLAPSLTSSGRGVERTGESRGQDPVIAVTHSLRADGFDASEDGTGRGTPLVPVAYRTNAAGQVDAQGECTAALTTQTDPTSQFIAFSCKDHGADAGDTSPTLRAMTHSGSHPNAGGQVAVAIPLQEVGKRTGISTTDPRAGIGIGADGEPMYTLQAGAQHTVAFAQNTRDEVRLIGGDGSIVGALAAEPGMKQQSYIGCFKGGQGSAAGSIGYDEHLSPTLSSADSGTNRTPALMAGMQVRRLTPRECERLQGFPDDYTLVPYRGKPAADGPRYKALGNSMAVPCMSWLGERIQLIDGLMVEQAA
jgi:DNA (cytosine-5)-methyltransferase 1